VKRGGEREELALSRWTITAKPETEILYYICLGKLQISPLTIETFFTSASEVLRFKYNYFNLSITRKNRNIISSETNELCLLDDFFYIANS